MKPYFLFFLIIIIIIICFIFKRHIFVNLIFIVYDIYSLYGLYWPMDSEYCSLMKNGFKPVMPLKYYADFNKAIFPRIKPGDNSLNSEQVIQICDRNLNWLLENGEVCHKPIQIEILYLNSPDFDTKVMTYLKNDYPFVMRGVKLKCFETMRFDNLMEKIGNDKVYMSPSSEETCPDNIFTEFKNITKNKCYITNSTNLFNYYDDLLPDSDMKIIENIIHGYMTNDTKQLFVGVVKGTGTSLHAAYTNNFFIMIQGEKKWTFFNPNQLALLYPNFDKRGVYMASQSRFFNMDTDINSISYNFPLLKYAERYEVDLEEGDILYNPQSWFHSVYNKTDISVACSTRWSDHSKPYTNLMDRNMLRYGNLSCYELRNYTKELYIEHGVLGISQIDEHKLMIGEKSDSIPLWDKYTNNAHNLCKNEDCSKNWHNNI